MVKDLKNMVWACEPCEKNRISKPNEPLLQTLDAWRPFQQVSVDLAQLDGKHYLVLADRYSGWPEVKLLNHLDTNSIIKVLETIFETFGIPERVRTDGGPQFRREFANWCEELGMVHELTSPYRPESNGHAEQAVGAMKKLLKKTGGRRKQMGQALLEYRNAPRVGDELSPAQWLFGRRQRTRAPATSQQYKRISDVQLAKHMEKRLANAEKVKEKGPKLTSKPFKPGDRVVVQDPISKLWETHGHVVEMVSRRRYCVRADAGHELTRNGKFIRLASQGGLGGQIPGCKSQAHPTPAQAAKEDNAPPREVVNASPDEPVTIPARQGRPKRKTRRPQRYLD